MMCILVKNHLDNKDGFTLIEVMVALVILMVAMLAVGSMQITAVRGNAFGKEMQTAVVVGREVLERVMSSPYDSVVAGNVTGLPAFDVEEEVNPDPSNPGFQYTRTWNVNNNTPFVDAATVSTTVTWNDSSGEHSITLNTIITR